MKRIRPSSLYTPFVRGPRSSVSLAGIVGYLHNHYRYYEEDARSEPFSSASVLSRGEYTVSDGRQQSRDMYDISGNHLDPHRDDAPHRGILTYGEP